VSAPRGNRRRLSWLALAAVLVVALVVGMGSREEPTRAERARNFAETVKCPTCRSQSVADSDAPIAVALRAEIEKRFAEGQNEDQVREYLLETNDEEIQLVPPKTGIGSLVWILPVAGLLVALGALAVAFRRWKLEPAPKGPSAADRELVARARRGEPGEPGDRVGAAAVADPHGEGDGR
jgi:cytochrome c-type biogenesis protein CcmH